MTACADVEIAVIDVIAVIAVTVVMESFISGNLMRNGDGHQIVWVSDGYHHNADENA